MSNERLLRNLFAIIIFIVTGKIQSLTVQTVAVSFRVTLFHCTPRAQFLCSHRIRLLPIAVHVYRFDRSPTNFDEHSCCYC